MTMIITRGDKKTLYYRALNNNKGVIDLTSIDVTYKLLDDPSDTTPIVEKVSTESTELKVVNATKGLFNVYLSSDDTALLDNSLYHVHISVGDDDIMTDVVKIRPYGGA